MARIVNTTIASTNVQRSPIRTPSDLQTSLQRLPSGLWINGAKGDAGVLSSIAPRTTGIRGMYEAACNAADDTSAGQTAEGAPTEIQSNLQRTRETAAQSSNGAGGFEGRDGSPDPDPDPVAGRCGHEGAQQHPAADGPGPAAAAQRDSGTGRAGTS